jgi:hypothetical protein
VWKGSRPAPGLPFLFQQRAVCPGSHPTPIFCPTIWAVGMEREVVMYQGSHPAPGLPFYYGQRAVCLGSHPAPVFCPAIWAAGVERKAAVCQGSCPAPSLPFLFWAEGGVSGFSPCSHPLLLHFGYGCRKGTGRYIGAQLVSHILIKNKFTDVLYIYSFVSSTVFLITFSLYLLFIHLESLAGEGPSLPSCPCTFFPFFMSGTCTSKTM